MRIIVVDDSMSFRVLARRALEIVGHTVIEVVDGSLAMDAIDRNRPIDMAIVDWNMPSMGGLELVQQIRSCPTYNRMRILCCTGNLDKTYAVAMADAGAQGYLVKPVTPKELQDRVQELRTCPMPAHW